jgi:hypothetical protein
MYGRLELCITCFGLRGLYREKEHRCGCQMRDAAWRASEWAGYDLPELLGMCLLCMRDVVASGTRWSWFACTTCREVNLAVGTALNSAGAMILPLGRHSLMNRVALPTDTEEDDPAVARFAEALLNLTGAWLKLHDWSKVEATRLATAAGWENTAVPLATWLEAFPASVGASVDAFCRFTGADLPETDQLSGFDLDRA